MGRIRKHRPVLLVVAAFSRHATALDWARDQARLAFGPCIAQSKLFRFEETTYYAPTMGVGLKKTFLAFEQLIDPGRLASIKHLTNSWEETFIEQSTESEARPLNLDPGYIDEAKLVLASTKDHAHRIYLRDGIYAEITLNYQNKRWRGFPWTFPDYQREDYHRFFHRCRRYLRDQRKNSVT